MPWETIIVNYEGAPPPYHYEDGRAEPVPLGTRGAVIDSLSSRVPELEWHECPPLLEQIKEFPDHPFHKLIPEWPDELVTASRPKLNALYETDALFAQLYGFESDPILSLHVEFRGSGDPLPFLRRICAPNNWSVVNAADGAFLDLSAHSLPGWNAFRKYRDGVTRQLTDAQHDPDES